MQIDYKGQRVRAQVTKYDATRGEHHIQWQLGSGSKSGRQCKALVDFCRDVVYGEVEMPAAHPASSD